MKLYGITNCDSVKKALQFFAARDINITLHDFRRDGLEKSWLKNIIARTSLQQLINNRSTTYRNLTDREIAQLQDPESACLVILQYPTLLKRPILILDEQDDIIIGYNKDVYNALMEDLCLR